MMYYPRLGQTGKGQCAVIVIMKKIFPQVIKILLSLLYIFVSGTISRLME